jgi:hypothetical protein
MARYLMAHLQNGRIGKSRILQEITALEMHRQQFTNHRRLPGRTYGFAETFSNGQRIISHGGGQPGYSSLLFLLPDHNLGFFVSCNLDPLTEGSNLAHEVSKQFMDRFFPDRTSPSKQSPPVDFLPRAHFFEGSYKRTIDSVFSLEKLDSFEGQMQVRSVRDGSLLIGSRRAVEIDPLLFQFERDGERAAFRQDSRGEITHLFIGAQSYEKVPWYATTPVNRGLLWFFRVFFPLSCLGWIFAGHLSRQRIQSSSSEGIRRGIWWLVLWISVSNLVFLWGFWAIKSGIDPWLMNFGLPLILYAFLVLPLLSTALTGMLAAIVLWDRIREGRWTHRGLIDAGFLSIASLFLLFLNYWNMIGIHV